MPRPDEAMFRMKDGSVSQLSCSTQSFRLTYDGPADRTVYVALKEDVELPDEPVGSCIVPYAPGFEGSGVFLPFNADRIYGVRGDEVWKRVWSPLAWSQRVLQCPEVSVQTTSGLRTIEVKRSSPGSRTSIAVYVKDIAQNDGWGEFLGSCDAAVTTGSGDKAIEQYVDVWASDDGACSIRQASRFGAERRERIYELFVRVFSNNNPLRKLNGTIQENGCGKFEGITAKAISEIAAMGFTHIWLMGVVRHATTTPYDLPGLAADETDLMKGLAGSPYAIKDYFDVAPDLAVNPVARMIEFHDLVARIHKAGLKVLIDFVGNHVSRAYRSEIRADLSFGAGDDVTRFFAPDNNFFYLEASDEGGGPPLRLPTFDPATGAAISPTCVVKGDCDGLFAPELKAGRVTGNNRISWKPSLSDWYETVKLNYGFDFAGRMSSQRQYPNFQDVDLPIPDTWLKVDSVLAHWQHMGIDGFRCDMAHMLPPEFWQWSIARARKRDGSVFFMAEAYNDFFVVPTMAPEVQALRQQPLFYGLLHVGFNAIYGHDLYRTIKNIYDGSNWANDIDAFVGSDYVSQYSVHYSENHDEIRLASPYAWGGVGLNVGRAASAILFGVARGPILFYSGQEVGEAAVEAEGFSGADGRTSLFDYWSLPAMNKWMNGGSFDGAGLSFEQQQLRRYYARLIQVCGLNVFRRGIFIGLNAANRDNPAYGRFSGDSASGHWIYSALRYDPIDQATILIVANLHESHDFTDLLIMLPDHVLTAIGRQSGAPILLRDLLGEDGRAIHLASVADGVRLPVVPALTTYYLVFEDPTTTQT